MTPEVLNYRKWQQGTHFHCETCGEVFLIIERGWAPDEDDGTFDYREHTGHDVVQHHGTDRCDEDQEHVAMEVSFNTEWGLFRHRSVRELRRCW